MKTLIIGALTAAVLSLGLGSAPAFAGGHGHSYHHDTKCVSFGSFKACETKMKGLKDLFGYQVAPIYSTGPSSTAYGPCGNGYWSNPTAGICNIAISDDMNHGREGVVTDAGTAPTCTITKTLYKKKWWHYKEIYSTASTKDGSCKPEYHHHPR